MVRNFIARSTNRRAAFVVAERCSRARRNRPMAGRRLVRPRHRLGDRCHCRWSNCRVRGVRLRVLAGLRLCSRLRLRSRLHVCSRLRSGLPICTWLRICPSILCASLLFFRSSLRWCSPLRGSLPHSSLLTARNNPRCFNRSPMSVLGHKRK